MKVLPLVAGVLMGLAGLVFTLQGLGYLEGSPMTDQPVWAILGPLIAGFGVALVLVSVRRKDGTPRR